ncbi:LOW QUALITY PROTEIN: CD9 antigen-like [Brachionichthys hirsutus]|uniref:LOW QUALITY PROTEIN: CD9 antigen-like n=1 Tax=Brachionichthys hirsutus TaxID=412623 RepID=UPI0036046B21
MTSHFTGTAANGPAVGSAGAGLRLLGSGLALRLSPNTRGYFSIEALNSSAFVTAVVVLIVIGTVLLILVSFGIYGACSEKRCPLQLLSALLAILAVTVIAFGAIAYSSRDQVVQSVEEFYSSIYAMYVATEDPAIGATLTFIHETLSCCGMTGITVLELVKATCPRGFFTKNCPGVIADVFNNHAPVVLGVFVGTGALLVVALICSAILSKQIGQSASSPQYITLIQHTYVPADNQPAQPQLATTCSHHPYPDPVVFTPLTVANIPAAQA